MAKVWFSRGEHPLEVFDLGKRSNRANRAPVTAPDHLSLEELARRLAAEGGSVPSSVQKLLVGRVSSTGRVASTGEETGPTVRASTEAWADEPDPAECATECVPLSMRHTLPRMFLNTGTLPVLSSRTEPEPAPRRALPITLPPEELFPPAPQVFSPAPQVFSPAPQVFSPAPRPRFVSQQSAPEQGAASRAALLLFALAMTLVGASVLSASALGAVCAVLYGL